MIVFVREIDDLMKNNVSELNSKMNKLKEGLSTAKGDRIEKEGHLQDLLKKQNQIS